jgi:hypothetical protein
MKRTRSTAARMQDFGKRGLDVPSEMIGLTPRRSLRASSYKNSTRPLDMMGVVISRRLYR